MARDIAKEQGGEGRRPVIGIVPTQDDDSARLEFPERYLRAIAHAGGAPLLLPLSGEAGVYETLFPLIDGFVLTGGVDIDPARYGAIADSGKISRHSPAREELEYLILSYAYRFDLPLLGICRGMQMINVCLGGTLYRDLDDQFSGVRRRCWEADHGDGRPQRLVHWQDEPYARTTHRVRIAPNSRLGRVVGGGVLEVNSMHHQGVCDLSALVDAVAFASDGLVEGIEVRDRRFIVGVQWHPEFFNDPRGQRIASVFDALVDAAGDAHGRERGTVHVRHRVGHDGLSRQDAGWPVVEFADCI